MPPRAIALPTSATPSGSAGGDLSGTYPNPTVAKVGSVTPSAFTLTLIDETDAPAWRSALGLGTAAVETVSTAAPRWTGGSASQVLIPGRSANLCEASAIADLVANCPADWLAVDGSGKMTASRASNGTVSMVRTTTGSDLRENLTMPRIQLRARASNYRFTSRVAVPNTGGGGTFFGGGPFVHTGNTDGTNRFFGAFTWQTNFQPWDQVVGGIQTVTISAGAYIWYRLCVTGTAATLEYSTATAEPADGDTSASTGWVFGGRSVLLPGVTAAAQLLPFVLGLGPMSLTGGTQYTVTATCCRIEWW